MNIDKKKLKITVKIINKYFKDSSTKVADVEFPDIIEPNSNDYFIYIFYSCLLDYGMCSKIYHRNLINTYNNYPQVFDSKYVLNNLNKNDLYNIIKEKIHARYPNTALKKWISLSYELSKYDNLRAVISSFKSFDALSKFIKNIKGYGQKTGGLLLRLIYESGICSFEDDINVIPLDRHDIEISYLNGIIDNKKISNKDIAKLSNYYIDVCKRMNIKPNLFDRYLWEIGNKFCNKKDCINCPLYTNCKKGKDSHV